MADDNLPVDAYQPTLTPAPGTAITPWGKLTPEQQQQRLDTALSQAKQTWPRLANWKIKLQPVSGQAGNSETYGPAEDANTDPHNWMIQLYDNPLNDPNPSTLRDYVGLESLHYLQKEDPTYQDFTEQFIKSMTPQQHAAAHNVWMREMAERMIDPGANRSELYEPWLRRVQAQEYIRGGVDLWPITSWRTENRSDPYTPEQDRLMKKIVEYLKTPDKNTHPDAYQLGKLLNSGVAN